MRIECPWCGVRDHREFTYGGDATKIRPETTVAAEWIDYVYLRDNPRGPHFELWQHTAGCRQWLTVHRDTVTHEVLDVRLGSERPS